MKVIFLDIDGVLNTKETYDKIYRNKGFLGIYDIEIDKFRLEYLKEIIDQTDAKIVLSSSFRHFFAKENNKIIPTNLKSKKVYDIFNCYGLEIYDTTPTGKQSREEEIQHWLSTRDDIESFIIIDDDPSMFYALSDKLIQTSKVRLNYLMSFMNESFGLCERHIPEVVDRLNKKTKVLSKTI